ncbi:MAG: 50S ribosomal protein L24e [Nanoarchaeota archaeon]|nr:50S ribosomal protein L24e [Nanoarchaeota archaeon]
MVNIKCSFCTKELEKGTGKMYIKTDSKIFYFCSRRCEKNMFKLGRDPLRVKWITKKKK